MLYSYHERKLFPTMQSSESILATMYVCIMYRSLTGQLIKFRWMTCSSLTLLALSSCCNKMYLYVATYLHVFMWLDLQKVHCLYTISMFTSDAYSNRLIVHVCAITKKFNILLLPRLLSSVIWHLWLFGWSINISIFQTKKQTNS